MSRVSENRENLDREVDKSARERLSQYRVAIKVHAANMLDHVTPELRPVVDD